MSLAIDVDEVAEVLLPDGWHKVADKSFVIDAYEYMDGKELVFGGGHAKEVIPSTGACWKESNGAMVYCPLTSIIAVKSARATAGDTGVTLG